MRERLARREFPLLASATLLVAGMFVTAVSAAIKGQPAVAMSADYWHTLVAADRLAHLAISGLYTQPTRLSAPPGAAVILLPVTAVISAAGLPLQIPGPVDPHLAVSAVWLLGGPYEIALSCVALFAADALAEELGVADGRRALLAAAGAVALWGVVIWGHPEDAVAVGLLLYAVLALRTRLALAGWLAGAAVCVQTLVLLAIPALLAVLAWRRMPGFLLRAGAPAAVLLGAAAIANWHATEAAVTSQPMSLVRDGDHPTAWVPLAPHLSGGYVAAGPARSLTILLACCGFAIRRRRLAGLPADARWPPVLLADTLWWAACALALRSFFEPVMVAYYLWPVLAVALIVASLAWRRLIAAAVITAAITVWAQGGSHDPWIWWAPLVVGLAALLIIARAPAARGGARSRAARRGRHRQLATRPGTW
jgi:hypothetical protein